MLRFTVFQPALSADGQPSQPNGWRLAHANSVGPDDLALPAEIEMDDSTLTCIPRLDGSCAVSLQYPIDGFGSLTVRTCLLPERNEPYLLSLELARHRVMQVLNKIEEWALFDQPASEPAIAAVEKAREAFTSALHAIRAAGGGFTPEADASARAALALAMDAGEQLAQLHSRVQHTRRITGELAAMAAKPPPPNALTDHESRRARSAISGAAGVFIVDMPRVGCNVHTGAFAEPLCAAVVQSCDFVTLPMRWIDMEPTEGKYAFAKTDKWIEWAVLKAKLPVTAGPVLDLSPSAVPDWLYIWEHDYETLRDVVIAYIKTIVTRYRRTVNTWTICSGLNTGLHFSLNYEQALDLTRTCVLLCKKLHPQGRVQVELVQPWGEYTARPKGQSATPPLVYGEMLKQLQVPLDAVSLRVQMGRPEFGCSTRDLMELSDLIDHLGGLDLPISLSLAGVPASPPPPADLGEESELDPGFYRQPWSPESQARWLRAAGAAVAGKCCVQSLCWQELYDAPGDGNGGLMTSAGQPRPALAALTELRQSLKERRPALPGHDGIW
ncbi:MAG: endo-1,4-beta-xylanase [Phycisphaerales bacterium]